MRQAAEPYRLTATEGIALIHSGRMTGVEWTRSCLARAGSLEPQLHAWAFLDPGVALKAAEQADCVRKERGSAGPLEGAPLGVKDIFNTAQMPAGMGSPLWKGFTPGNDARVVATLKRRGAVVMGKTATSEFAVHFPGPTRNPHDPDRSPGTSSSGSAVAVATGMVPFALGSQTAGSTIRPASYCGVYGFKPSFGLVPRTGMLKTTDTLDHVSFLARSAQDIRLIFHHARVRGGNHPFVQERVDGRQELPEPAPWRVGLVRGPHWSQAQPYVRAALEEFARRLSGSKGFRVEEFEELEGVDQVHAAHQRIYCRMLAYYFQPEGRRPEGLSDSFRQMLETGWKVSILDFQKDLEFQAQFTRRLDRRMEETGTHALLDFSTAAEAPLGLHAPDLPDHCLIWTFAGMPALSVPAFRAPSGLPFGLQLVGRRYGDYALLQFAQRLTEVGFAEPGWVQEPREETGAGIR